MACQTVWLSHHDKTGLYNLSKFLLDLQLSLIRFWQYFSGFRCLKQFLSHHEFCESIVSTVKFFRFCAFQMFWTFNVKGSTYFSASDAHRSFCIKVVVASTILCKFNQRGSDFLIQVLLVAPLDVVLLFFKERGKIVIY